MSCQEVSGNIIAAAVVVMLVVSILCYQLGFARGVGAQAGLFERGEFNAKGSKKED